MYFYKVTAYNTNGESGFPQGVAAGFRMPTCLLKPPGSAYLISSTGSITIGWTMPSTGRGFTGFKVYRIKIPDGGVEYLGYTTEYQYTDTPPEKAPTVYEYHLSAVNSLGDGDLAGPVSVSLQ